MPSVTIGLLTHNRVEMLPRAIESALQQTYRDFELIISDDNSKDNTSSVVEGYRQRDSRIIYRRRKGIGMTQNFIETLADATGNYFMWLCDDDYLSPNYLENCIAFLSQNNDYALVCGLTKFVVKGEVVDRIQRIDLESNDAKSRVTSYFRNVDRNVVLYGVMRKRQVQGLKYPDTFGADLLWSLQVVFIGKVKILDTACFYYSLAGISQETSNLKAYYRTTRHTNRNPYTILRSSAFALIVDKKGVFTSLGFITRLRLAVQVAFIIRERFCMPSWEARVRRSLRLRSRLKSMFND